MRGLWRLGAAIGWVCGVLAVGTAFAAEPPAPPVQSHGAAAAHASWIEWHTHRFFSSCEGNCGIALYGGREDLDEMSKILVRAPRLPWNWNWGRSGLIAGSFSRRLVTLLDVLDIEPEVGVGQRFGDMHATELWAALVLRWTEFPWNDYVKTTIAIADGPSYATRIDLEERYQTATHLGSHLLNTFSPELTFALPSAPSYELMLRYQHRSGIFGVIDGVHGGAQFGTIGIRHRW